MIKFFRDIKKTREENKILRGLLTDAWWLLDRATLIFGFENNQEYYAAWDRYREIEKKCEPFLNSIFKTEAKSSKQNECKNKAGDFIGIELNPDYKQLIDERLSKAHFQHRF